MAANAHPTEIITVVILCAIHGEFFIGCCGNALMKVMLQASSYLRLVFFRVPRT
jgi:hypothetical protein